MRVAAPAEFEAIVRQTQSHIRAYIAGMGVTGPDVDDVAQDVYLELYRNFERIPADLPPERWLKGIARNLCMNFFRRASRRGRLHRQALAEMLARLEAGDGGEPSRDGESSLELTAALASCLQKLGAESRRLVLLRYERELPSADIAAELNSTAEAIRVALFRIRGKLKQCIDRRLAEEAPA